MYAILKGQLSVTLFNLLITETVFNFIRLHAILKGQFSVTLLIVNSI